MSGTDFLDPTRIDTRYQSRSVSFENPTGERGAGGTAHGGRKGAPARAVHPGERVVLADLEGPGTIRHLWLTVFPVRPDVLRGLLLEVTYDGLPGPSIAVPVVDFFGVPHGRPVAYASALTAIQEGRGFNAYLPMPFARRCRVEFVNASSRAVPLFYSLDYTLDPAGEPPASYLHVTWRRENPTTLGRDFVIVDGLEGPGRFLGCNVGVRVLDEGDWYGEGEVKVYLDGDTDLPTICGTGLEDYCGSAWGLGAHAAPYAGAPLDVRPTDTEQQQPQPHFVGFYRWHLPDPILFERDLRVTIQQIGIFLFRAGQEAEFEHRRATRQVAGEGWLTDPSPGLIGQGIVERIDDYCATAYVYCERPQVVPAVDVALATADVERRPYEQRAQG